ncbi:MAG: hypothetical protein QOH85_1167 [Acidobacteriaceae bacterium]|nr:hypothetical protein [Acidobacteriaceae bacterium]
MKGEKTRDMTFALDGSLIEVEQEISAESLRSHVSAPIQQGGRGRQVGKIESVTRGGVVTACETTIRSNGTEREVAFRPDGTRRAAD